MDATIDRSETDQAEPRAWPARAPDLTGLEGFSAEDIFYNRAGQLSPTQRRQLRTTMFLYLALLSIPLAAIVAMSVWGFNTGLALWSLCFLLTIPGLLRIASDFRAGVVAVAEGNAWTEFKNGGDDPDQYWLHIADLKLEITSEAYKVIRAGGRYRACFVASSERLVGAEVLRGWQPIGRAVAPSTNGSEPAVDWETLMNQLYEMTDNALGNRAKKVREMLASTEKNLDALDRTIDRISQAQIRSVDPTRLTTLAKEMRQAME